ncbi:unnamed protein product, partial [Symbiodinium microadriaticum]
MQAWSRALILMPEDIKQLYKEDSNEQMYAQGRSFATTYDQTLPLKLDPEFAKDRHAKDRQHKSELRAVMSGRRSELGDTMVRVCPGMPTYDFTWRGDLRMDG